MPKLVCAPNKDISKQTPAVRINPFFHGCSNAECQYSCMAKLGKPKGSRNKRTLEKMAHASCTSGSSARNSPQRVAASRCSSVAPWANSIPASSTFASEHSELQLQQHPACIDLDPCLDFSPQTEPFTGTVTLQSGFSSSVGMVLETTGEMAACLPRFPQKYIRVTNLIWHRQARRASRL